jgi:transposase
MPSLWAAPTPAQTCWRISITSPSAMRPDFEMMSRSVCPATYSMATYAGWRKSALATHASSYCLAHGHRKFKELEESFPKECSRVLRSLQLIFLNDNRTGEMSDQERLEYHQKYSAPVMESLRDWMREQFLERAVEPNSALGKAFNYVLGNFEELTAFLRVSGAPISNNEVERALKRFVLLRKNSLFFKTPHGAEISGILMSVIETCKLSRSNTWEYLLALMRNQKEARKNPGDWLPWNYPREGVEEAEPRAA